MCCAYFVLNLGISVIGCIVGTCVCVARSMYTSAVRWVCPFVTGSNDYSPDQLQNFKWLCKQENHCKVVARVRVARHDG